MSDFVHLHVHSHYSLLDALPKIPELVKAAKAKGFKALALTDHANLYGAIEFYETCQREGIKPIIGCEVNVTSDSLQDKTVHERAPHHLVLLVENQAGYNNLMKLVSLGNTLGLRPAPLVTTEWLLTHHQGLVALSGCIDGALGPPLRHGGMAKAKAVAAAYRDIFGPDHFFLELNDLAALSGQIEINTALIKLGQEMGIPLVVTRDVHYLEPADAEAQDILTCIGGGRVLDEPNRPSKRGVDYSLATTADIASRFKHVPEALANTVAIAERTDLKLKLNQWHFPAIDLPVGAGADQHLQNEVWRLLPTLLPVTPEVRERAEYELEIIVKKHYSPYFLAVADYIRYARDHGIIETTRGSAAGSIVSFALGITNVNPLFFKLPFERFLNPFRPSPPDIDADFADDRRDEIIKYVTDKYGADKVAQIITFGTMMARAAVRDVGRALGLSYTFCDQVAKLIPFGAQGFHITINRALELEPDLKKLHDTNAEVKRLLGLARAIEGCARHTSIHAAGVVISPTNLTDFTPIQHETGGSKIITQYDMHSVEAAGLLKMDFLGIRNLSILGHAVEIVEKTTGQKVDIHNLAPWDDKKTYEMLARGETVGVFQLASSGMTRYLKELKPTNIFDIMAMVALFRPGPMESIPEYIRRKHHPELIDYLDPRMKDYLDQSLGLIVYQDDVLLTAINLGGYSWKEADTFRKAMGKKIPAEMAKQKEKFFTGCRQHGKLSELKIHRLWELIEPFAAYGFNKAHAASYGVVAYQTAFMKANWPIQYMTAVLIAESGEIDKVPAIIHECERLGIKVLPPDINESFKNFAMIPENDEPSPPFPSSAPFDSRSGRSELVERAEEGKPHSLPSTEGGAGGEASRRAAHIRFGLNGIKNLGEHIAEVIFRERRERGVYRSLEDFLSRIQDKDLNKKSLESLIRCGALDSLGHDRGMLLHNVENLLSFMRDSQERLSSKQHSMFAGSAFEASRAVRLESAPPASSEVKLAGERELLGLYVSSHPFAPFEQALSAVLTPVGEITQQPRNHWVVVGGVVEATKKKITRQGAAMLFATIQDTTGNLELLIFPRTYEATKDVWAVGRPVCVVGRTGETEGDDKLFVEKAYQLAPETVSAVADQLYAGFTSLRQYVPAASAARLTEAAVEITLSPAALRAKADTLKALLSAHPGNAAVYLKVAGKKIKTSYHVQPSAELTAQITALTATP